MYERFTDRARKAMQLANQEAQRFNHELIQPLHIAVGIIKEGHGVACEILRRTAPLDFPNLLLHAIREKLEKGYGSAGDEVVIMGRLPHSPDAKRVVESAVYHAKDVLGTNYVGTEHLLLGFLQVSEPMDGGGLFTAKGLGYFSVLAAVRKCLSDATLEGKYETPENEADANLRTVRYITGLMRADIGKNVYLIDFANGQETAKANLQQAIKVYTERYGALDVAPGTLLNCEGTNVAPFEFEGNIQVTIGDKELHASAATVGAEISERMREAITRNAEHAKAIILKGGLEVKRIVASPVEMEWDGEIGTHRKAAMEYNGIKPLIDVEKITDEGDDVKPSVVVG